MSDNNTKLLEVTRLQSTGKPTVVAIDDQADATMLLKIRLKSAGFECTTFCDPAQGLNHIIKSKPDVVILDILMPLMNGFEVCKRLKENESTRDIPIVFLTANDDTEEVIKALDMGAHDFLSKPVNQQELVARTRSAVRVKKLQDQLKQQIQNEHQFQDLQKQKLTEHWQKTFSQLAASLAHEINNPLAAALGIVQLMSVDPVITSEQSQRLTSVADCLYRVSRKMNSLLQIAQTETDPQLIELRPFLDDLLVLANFTVSSHNVTLLTDFQTNGVWTGILSEWARVIWYVLNNSIEAVVGREKPQVVLSSKLSESGALLVSISDNGVGIPEGIQSRIFEPFLTTKGPPHNGVGLYLASEILKKGGGKISFQSPCEPFSTRFTITFPADTKIIPNSA